VLSYLHASVLTATRPLPVEQLASDFALRLRIWAQHGLLALGCPPRRIGALLSGLVRVCNYTDDPVGEATRAWVESGRTLALSGSLVRTHPIGIIGLGFSEEETWEFAAAVSRTTHVDTRCVLACCIQAALVRALLRGEIQTEDDVDDCTNRAYGYVRHKKEWMDPAGEDSAGEDIDDEVFLERIQRDDFVKYVMANSLEELEPHEPESTGYVYKCHGAAIWSLKVAIRRDSRGSPRLLRAGEYFEMETVSLIMEGGDAGTNAAAAGALVGAYVGNANLPAHWLLGLRHKEWPTLESYRLAIATDVLVEPLRSHEDDAPDAGRFDDALSEVSSSGEELELIFSEEEIEGPVKRAKVTEKAKAKEKTVEKTKAKATEVLVEKEKTKKKTVEKPVEKQKQKTKEKPAKKQKTKEQPATTQTVEKEPTRHQPARKAKPPLKD
jgi:hypothetical protein